MNDYLRREQGEKLADNIHILLATQAAVTAPEIELSQGRAFNNVEQVNLDPLDVEISQSPCRIQHIALVLVWQPQNDVDADLQISLTAALNRIYKRRNFVAPINQFQGSVM